METNRLLIPKVKLSLHQRIRIMLGIPTDFDRAVIMTKQALKVFAKIWTLSPIELSFDGYTKAIGSMTAIKKGMEDSDENLLKEANRVLYSVAKELTQDLGDE